MTYQFDPDLLPDEAFRPGRLEFLVPGNTGRLLDPTRTPIQVVELKDTTGSFVVEILAFEDKGAKWEVPFEEVNQFQFDSESLHAEVANLSRFRKIMSRLNQLLRIPAMRSNRIDSDQRIASLRQKISRWLDRESAFLSSGASWEPSSGTSDPALWDDLKR